jgi:hypothetical protein
MRTLACPEFACSMLARAIGGGLCRRREERSPSLGRLG